MKLSIITPVWNREKLIKRAMVSVAHLKAVKGLSYEHIIVNDGSTDMTSQVIQRNLHEHTVFIDLKKNKGVNGARNAGIRKAKGDYILLFDSDDELVPETLEIIKEALENTNKQFYVYKFFVKLVGTNKVLSKTKKVGKNISYKDKLAGVAHGEFISVVKTDIFKKNLFDEQLFCFESAHWNKLSKKYHSEIIIPNIIRIYYPDSEDRLSKALIAQDNYAKRYRDYKTYLDLFEKDYQFYNLHKQLANIYFITATYAHLCGEKSSTYYQKAYSTSPSLKIWFFHTLSKLGIWPIELSMKLYRVLSL